MKHFTPEGVWVIPSVSGVEESVEKDKEEKWGEETKGGRWGEAELGF